MQILKDDVKSNILESSKKLFLKDGFQKTPMEAIACKSGISKGNLYNYFKSKEDIFDALVFSSVVKLEKLTKKFMGTDFEMGDHIFSNLLIEQLGKLYGEREELQLIIYCSSGTKYEHVIYDAKQQLAKKISRRIFKDIQNKHLSLIIANNLISCIIEIVSGGTTRQEFDTNVRLLALYHEFGVKGLLSVLNST